MTTETRLGDLHRIGVERDHWGNYGCDGCDEMDAVFLTLDAPGGCIDLCRGCAERLHAKLGEMLEQG